MTDLVLSLRFRVSVLNGKDQELPGLAGLAPILRHHLEYYEDGRGNFAAENVRYWLAQLIKGAARDMLGGQSDAWERVGVNDEPTMVELSLERPLTLQYQCSGFTEGIIQYGARLIDPATGQELARIRGGVTRSFVRYEAQAVALSLNGHITQETYLPQGA